MTVRVTREAEPQIELDGAYVGEVLGVTEGNRASLAFTPTGHSLIVVPKNAVSQMQVEVGGTATTFQTIGANFFDVTEEGDNTGHHVTFDFVDDKLATDSIMGGITGQAFVAGAGGCYITDLTVADGGAFEIGRLSSALQDTWTDAPFRALRAVAGVDEQVFDALLRSGDFTDEEIARLEAYYVARGGKGLLVEGPELAINGTFDTDTDWTKGTGWTISGGKAHKAPSASTSTITQPQPLLVDGFYVSRFTISNYVAGSVGILAGGNAATPLVGGNGDFKVIQQYKPSATILLVATSTFQGSIDNVTVKKLTPREEL